MHTIQKELLKRLVQNHELSFSELTAGFNSEDNIVFHLKKLISQELVQKQSKQYLLTHKGLKLSGSFRLDSLQEKEYKTTYFGFIVELEDTFLLRKREYESVFYKLPGGKPFYGENIAVARQRLFQQATGIVVEDGMFHFDSLHLKIQKTSAERNLFDDTLVVYKVDLPMQLQTSDCNPRTGNNWYTREEIRELPGKWPEIDICLLRKDWQPYLEYEFVNDYGLSKIL